MLATGTAAGLWVLTEALALGDEEAFVDPLHSLLFCQGKARVQQGHVGLLCVPKHLGSRKSSLGRSKNGWIASGTGSLSFISGQQEAVP